MFKNMLAYIWLTPVLIPILYHLISAVVKDIKWRKSVQRIKSFGSNNITHFVRKNAMNKSEVDWELSDDSMILSLEKGIQLEYATTEQQEFLIRDTKGKRVLFRAWYVKEKNRVEAQYDQIAQRHITEGEKQFFLKFLITIDSYYERKKKKEIRMGEKRKMSQLTLLEIMEQKIFPQRLEQVLTEIEEDKRWLSRESLHKLEVTLPGDIKILNEAYGSLRDKNKGKREIEKSFAAIENIVSSMKEEIENNKLQELSIRRQIIEKR